VRSPVPPRAATRLLAAVLLSGFLLAGSAGSGLLAGSAGSGLLSQASAAEAGVNLNTLEPSGVIQAKKLGVHWIRVFAPWPDLEPSPGVYSAFWFPRFERLLDSLPKGVHAMVEFV
jgi:hypothetical protein